MLVVTIQNIRQGIEYALSNGKRLFDDATLLYKNGRFSSCIVQDIFAYEEFNKAKKMLNFLGSGTPFRMADLDKLTNADSHKDKVLYHAVRYGDMLKDDSPEKYRGRGEFASQMGLPFPTLPRDIEIALHNDTTRYFAELHNLRKTLLYSGFDEKTNMWFGADRFENDKLRAICGYLYYEVILPYYETLFNLSLLDQGISADRRVSTPEQQAIISNDPYAIAANKTILMCRTDDFVRNYEIYKAVIDAL